MTHELTRRRRQWRYAIVAMAVIAASVSACSDYHAIAPPKETHDLYWELKADHRAVMLSMTSPHNTLQLTAIPYNVHGSEISLDAHPEPTKVVWESADTSAVGVSQTGVISAKKVATRVNVYVTLSVGAITHRDTIWVRVTPTAPRANYSPT